MSEHMSPIPSRLYNAAVGGHVAGADQIIDDETGLTLDKVAGGALEEKEYTSGSDNGMGRVVLRKNLVNGVNTLTQAMINKNNTIYVIQYDFTLGEDITVPANCVLEFDGGIISGNYSLTLNGAKILASHTKIFNNITISSEEGIVLKASWFGLNGNIDCSDAFVKLLKAIRLKSILVIDTDVLIQNPVIIGSNDFLYHSKIIGENQLSHPQIICDIDNSAISLKIQEVIFEDILFKGKSTTDILTLHPDSYLGDNDSILINCNFYVGKSGLTSYGRGTKLYNCAFSQVTTAINFVGKCIDTSSEEYQTVDISQRQENSGRAIIVSECRFHLIDYAIVFSPDPDNINYSFLGARIENNTADSMCCFINVDNTKIRNLIISGNVTAGQRSPITGQSITDLFPHFRFKGYIYNISIINNSFSMLWDPDTDNWYNTLSRIQFCTGSDVKNIIINDNVFGASSRENAIIYFELENAESIIINNNIIAESSWDGQGVGYRAFITSGNLKNIIANNNIYEGTLANTFLLYSSSSIQNARLLSNIGFANIISTAATKTNVITDDDIINN